MLHMEQKLPLLQICRTAGSTLARRASNPNPGAAGWDPLGLGANEERLTWFAEAERVHARWSMLAVAGILVQVRDARNTNTLGLPAHCTACLNLPPTAADLPADQMQQISFLMPASEASSLLPVLQEITRPDVFWYEAATKIDLPFNIVGLVLFQLFCMHWVETKVRTPQILTVMDADSQ